MLRNVDMMNIREFHIHLIYFPLYVLRWTLKKGPSDSGMGDEDNTQGEMKEWF